MLEHDCHHVDVLASVQSAEEARRFLATTPIAPDVQQKTACVLGGPGTRRDTEAEGKLSSWTGRMEWDALKRQLDRADTSYRN
mgnify:CR=1 FL=1